MLYLLLSVACNSNLSLEENYWDHNCVIHTEDFRGSHDHLNSDLHSHHNGSYLSNKIVFVGLFHCMQTAFYSNLYPWESLHRNCLSHKSSRRYSDCHLHSYLAGGHTNCQQCNMNQHHFVFHHNLQYIITEWSNFSASV